MAAPDPRRSSRARAHSQSQQSSTTSSISGRAERTTRSLNKSGSPQKSTPTGSLSSEPPDDLIEASDDHLLRPRRTRSNNEDRENKATNPDDNEMANGADDIQEDDEAVRCICGHEDYPGPPSLEDLKRVAKEGIDLEAVFPTEITEDLAGFFVQCDVCHVWQHGACVGLSNDDTLPEEYFCEECREDFHRIFKTSLGRRFSLYLPLERNSRAVSLVKEGTRSPKGKETRNSKASAASQSSKRRSTMNSRDAAYDEEEQLRRAIEASREDNSTDGAEVATRRTKRGRSGSEEKLEAAPKRQRTSSRSPSPQPDKQPEGDESDDQAGSRNGASKKSRNSVAAAARTQREKSEKAEKERQRAEAANKRKGRAERRRADGIQPTILVKPSEAHQDTDSDPSEELPLAARAPTNPPPPPAPEPVQQPEAPVSSHQATPDTPPASAVPMAVSKSKGGRPTHKKKGRNQYTKDRDDGSPARSQSRDVQDTPNSGNTRTGGGEHSKSSRSKGGMNSRVTMSEMKRRATAMFDYISRTQLELAGEASPAQAHASPAGSKDDAPASTDAPSIVVNGGTSSPKKLAGNKGTENGDKPTKEFKELSCVEMMDYLTRDLVHWQNQFVA